MKMKQEAQSRLRIYDFDDVTNAKWSLKQSRNLRLLNSEYTKNNNAT